MRFTAYNESPFFTKLFPKAQYLPMSVPAVGQYVIYNTIPGQFGEKLAVTFHGVAQSLIVDTLAPNNNQQLVCSRPSKLFTQLLSINSLIITRTCSGASKRLSP